MKKLILLAVLTLISISAAAQNTVNSALFGSSWNSVSPSASPPQPNPWCPQDSNGNIATLTSFRIWDDGMKWSQVETSASSPTDTSGYTFTKMDYVMNTLAPNPSCTMKVLYQFGATPSFAAGTNSLTGCASPGSSSCTPPQDINGDGTGADAWWMNYVGQLLGRYKGKIAYYGLWNEADSSNFWCFSGTGCGSSNGGNPATSANVPSLKNLVLMGWDAKQLMACIDPSAKMVSPDGHVGSMNKWFHNFVNTSITAPSRNFTITFIAGGVLTGSKTCTWSSQTVSGKQVFDIVDEHMRGTTSTNTDPTSVITAYNAAVTEMTTDSLLSYQLFNDEWGLNQGQGANTATAAAYTGIELSLMASFSNPKITQSNSYQWDNGNFPWSKSIVGLANDVVAGWLIGATVNNYSLSGSLYTIPGTFAGGGSFQIMFDNSKTCSGSTISTCTTANQSAGSFTHYTDLSGTVHTVSGGLVPVGLPPIILTGASGGTQAAQPTCSPNGGTFSSNQSETCSTTSGGAIICYTQNGSTPATNGASGCTTGTLYSGAFTISANETLKAVAGGSGFTDSTVYSASFTFQGSAPTFSLAAGTYTGSQTNTLTQAQSLQMCYTTDGSTPTSDGAGHCSNGTLYSSPVTITATETFKAIAMKSGWTDSAVKSASYTINYTLTVTVSGNGTVNSSPIGINSCTSSSGTCSNIFGQGTSITLTATPGSGLQFNGWSGGGCSGTGTCVLTLNSTTSVTATFTSIVPAFVAGQLIGVMLN